MRRKPFKAKPLDEHLHYHCPYCVMGLIPFFPGQYGLTMFFPTDVEEDYLIDKLYWIIVRHMRATCMTEWSYSPSRRTIVGVTDFHGIVALIREFHNETHVIDI